MRFKATRKWLIVIDIQIRKAGDDNKQEITKTRLTYEITLKK